MSRKKVDNTHPALPARMRKNPRLKHCTVNDVLIDRKLAFEVWQIPLYNRETINNKKVNEIAAALVEDPALRYDHLLIGCRGGVLYKVDGNHRMRAFEKSGLPTIRVNIHFVRFDSEEEEVEAYRQMQEQIKKSTPNDRLKVVSYRHLPIQHIDRECRFVTFGKAAKSAGSLVTMSTVVQTWEWSKTNPPRPSNGGSIEDLAWGINQNDSVRIVEFMRLCREQLGMDFMTLWKASNLALCLWLYRRLIWYEDADHRWSKLTSREFGSGLLAICNSTYAGRITGKKLSNDVDRGAMWSNFIRSFRKGLAEVEGRRNLRLPNIAGYSSRKVR